MSDATVLAVDIGAESGRVHAVSLERGRVRQRRVHRFPTRAAATFLTVPDPLHHWLSGARACEFTIASTTQLLDARGGRWSTPILEALGIDRALFPPVVQPGTALGSFEGVQVIAPAGHDTACAVAGVPAADDDFAYVSSGTWSLVGVEMPAPVVGPAALAENVTNEGGVAGTTRLLKNVTGLWILQQCQRTWQADGTPSRYGTLVREAERAPALRSLVDPDHPDFLAPGPHPDIVRAHCRATGQPEPISPGETVRAVLDSLALAYRRALEAVERVAGRSVGRIHVVGGGARNGLLCQATADASGRPVTAGPAEATVLGNGAVQLMTLGALSDLKHARRAIARGCRVRRYTPARRRGDWDAAYERWNAIEWPTTWRDFG